MDRKKGLCEGEFFWKPQPTTYFLPHLTTLGKIMTMVCIINQIGDLVSHRHWMDSPFGYLQCGYLDKKDISLVGTGFLLHGLQIKPDETPKSEGFCMGCNVLAFVNLLLYFNQDDELAYQSQYPLSIIDKSNGLLGEGAMGTAINVAVGRGNDVEVIKEVEGQLSPAYKGYCKKEGNVVHFFQWAFTWPTQVEAWWQLTTT
jgi:hypothetical protein